MNRTRKLYMHAVAGLCVLIHPDPEDGALLVMERVGDDEVAGTYFGCEASDLYHVGERVTGAVAKWEDSAPDEDRDIDPESVVVASVPPDDTLADPLGHNVPHPDRRFMWEPTDPSERIREYSWGDLSPGLHVSLRGTVRGGILRVVLGQWRRVH